MQYTCLDSMRTRIEELWPQLKEKLVQVLLISSNDLQNIREQLLEFDPYIYSNVFRTYSVLDAHLIAMDAQKIKKQQLVESASNRSLLKQPSQQAITTKKVTKKESYIDILQKYLNEG